MIADTWPGFSACKRIEKVIQTAAMQQRSMMTEKTDRKKRMLMYNPLLKYAAMCETVVNIIEGNMLLQEFHYNLRCAL
jgi:hypothetical protein